MRMLFTLLRARSLTCDLLPRIFVDASYYEHIFKYEFRPDARARCIDLVTLALPGLHGLACARDVSPQWTTTTSAAWRKCAKQDTGYSRLATRLVIKPWSRRKSAILMVQFVHRTPHTLFTGSPIMLHKHTRTHVAHFIIWGYA